MNILLIFPKAKYAPVEIKKEREFIQKIFGEAVSLTLPQVAAATPKEHIIKIIDENYEKLNFNENADLVGITCLTMSAPRAYEIADQFRKKGVKVVLGGNHPTALPKEAKQHADSIVVGEAEKTWPQLLKDFEKKQLKPFYSQKKPVDLKTIPPPDRKNINHKGGFIIEKIQASRGCVMGCEYCSITNSVYGRVFRFRPVEDVIEEIRLIPQKILYFCDPTLTMNPEYTKELFKKMKELNKKFYCNGNIDILHRDEELLKLSKDAGCIEWAIGFESICQESLNLIGKKTNNVKKYSSTIKKIHNHGIRVMGNFIFGLDGDYPDIFDNTIDLIYDWELDLVSFNIFTPFPGTPLFHYLEKENRIITRDWSKYDVRHVVFQPKHMSPQELQNGTLGAHKEFFSTYNSIKRTLSCLKYGPYSFLTTSLENFVRGA